MIITPGIHPDVFVAIVRVNSGHQATYSDDVCTEHLQQVFQSHFCPNAQTFPVFNGAEVNVVALQAIT